MPFRGEQKLTQFLTANQRPNGVPSSGSVDEAEALQQKIIAGQKIIDFLFLGSRLRDIVQRQGSLGLRQVDVLNLVRQNLLAGYGER
jgi:hypothetical protein